MKIRNENRHKWAFEESVKDENSDVIIVLIDIF